MNIGKIILGVFIFMLILFLTFITIYTIILEVPNKNNKIEIKETKCYDKYDNEIKDQICLDKIYPKNNLKIAIVSLIFVLIGNFSLFSLGLFLIQEGIENE